MKSCVLLPSSIMSDVDMLFRELSNRFPEVPSDVVTMLMKEHMYNRQKCIEGLAMVSNNYLYGQGDLAPDMSRVSISNNPAGTVPYSHGAAFDGNFRRRSDSAGSLSGPGGQGNISMNPHNSNQTTHVSTVYQRVDGAHYSSPGQSLGYELQPIPRRQVQIHISAGAQPHGYNSTPSHSLISQTQRGAVQMPHSGAQIAWSEEQWNGDVQYHPQYSSYRPPPVVQRQVTYNPEAWSTKIPNGPSRPHDFSQRFPNVSNGHENVSSPDTPSSATGVSPYSNKTTPSSPPTGMNSQQQRYGHSPDDSKMGVGMVEYPAQSHGLGSNGQYLLQPQSSTVGPAVNNNQSVTFQSSMFIPSPQTPVSARTPSPIHPAPPPNPGFFPGQALSSSARPPQSLPPFPLSSQRSSDSSPGTPRHQQYPQSTPHVFPHQSTNWQQQQQQQQQKRHRVLFHMPDPSVVSKEEHLSRGDRGYAVRVSEELNVEGQGFSAGQLQENRPARSGSIEDSQYMQTLLEYQSQRKSKLNDDLGESYRLLQRLQNDVGVIEKKVLERKKIRSTCTVTAEDIQKIRQENTRLKVEIRLLTHEIDVVNNGLTPLGVLDTHQLQSFYRNIEPGQRVSSQNNSRPSTPPTRVPPRPPPPQPCVSSPPQLPPPPPSRAPIAPREDMAERVNWTCSACTFLNHPDLDKCEMCEMPRLVGTWKDWELV